MAWGRLATNPTRGIRKVPIGKREHRVWTLADIRRFLLAADDRWRPFFAVAAFTGLRLGELQALAWEKQNRPNFTTNKIEVTCAYNDRTKRLGLPKSERSVRAVEMCPTVRRVLLELRGGSADGLVFPREHGGPLPPSVIGRVFRATTKRAEVVSIRFHDLRRTYASLLILAGKHPKYISAQIGHHSAAFTLDTYGHLMDRLPVTPVEWIDDLVFAGEAAPILHRSGAPSGVSEGHAVQRADTLEPVQDKELSNLVQSGAAGCMVGGAGLEPAASSV